ncbi:MAG: tetratricopeptide repeat protein [Bacilli bacterium]
MKKSILIIISIFATVFCTAQSYNFEQGVKAFKEDNLEQALDFFGRELNDNPKNPVAYFYCAVIYKYNENYAAALSNINNSIKNFTKKDKEWLASAYKLRADINVEIENFDKAFEDYALAIKMTPNDLDFYIDRAQVYFDLKKYEKSESDYRQVLKIDESNLLGWAGLGRNYLSQKKYNEAEQTLNKLIKLDPEYTGGYYYRSLLYIEQKKYDEAINDIFQCFLIDETDRQVRSLFVSFAKKNPSLALSKVNAKIAANPQNDSWYFIRAQIQETKSNFISAIEDYSKVMELTDVRFKSSILEYRADCYKNAGVYSKSIADYTESISLDSTNAYMYGYRADAKRLMGDYQGAINDFTLAINIEPREDWFYYRRGWVKDEFLKDYKGGLDDYNEAISINKDYAYTYLNRGRLYFEKLNSPEKGKLDFERILLLDSIVKSEGNCKHFALFHLGRKNDAIQWANKIIEQYPTEGNYYDLACLFSLMNEQKDAIENLTLAFQNGYRDFTHLSKDDDLDNIRNTPEFKNLVLEWQEVFENSLKVELNERPLMTEKKSETVTIPMAPKGSGIYEVSCKVNDLRLNFIFDTGASEISISQTEALFMLKNGYLNSNDIMGKQSYMDANGNISIGTKIRLRQVDFGGLILENITASVVHNDKAPLLFGQSALGKYGKIIIDNQKNTITIIKEN